jgi:hypothetical protein
MEQMNVAARVHRRGDEVVEALHRLVRWELIYVVSAQCEDAPSTQLVEVIDVLLARGFAPARLTCCGMVCGQVDLPARGHRRLPPASDPRSRRVGVGSTAATCQALEGEGSSK